MSQEQTDRIFVTGSSGFLGAELMRCLGELGRPLVALERHPMEKGLPAGSAAALVKVVEGDLLDPPTYNDALQEVETIVHLAAMTGKGSKEDHFRINSHATGILLDRAREAGVKKFILVSTIAVNFIDKSGYYYAQSKQEAEQRVAESGLDYTIVRPTIILGPGSPVLDGLTKLAQLPLVPVFGDGRARVQPTYVEDVAKFIVRLLREAQFSGKTYELGGATVLTIEELIREIRRHSLGGDGRVLHVPLALVTPPLRLFESFAPRLSPITVGQLSSFRNDGVAAEFVTPWGEGAPARELAEMLDLSMEAP